MKKVIFSVFAFLLVILGLFCFSVSFVSAACTSPFGGMKINTTTTFCSGNYSVLSGMTIAASGITLNCNGSILTGNGTNYAIKFNSGVSNVLIKNCNVRGYLGGFYLDSGNNNNVIVNNTANNNANGFFAYLNKNNTFLNNTANNNSNSGIFLHSNSGNILSGNTANDNRVVGIRLYGSANNSLLDNTVNNNFRGIGLEQEAAFGKVSANNLLARNIVKNNSNSGILLSENSTRNNSLSNNLVEANNPVGIHISGASNNMFSGNVFLNNPDGILLSYFATGNIFWQNNFTRGISDNVWETGEVSGNSWNQGSVGNYWSDFGTNVGYPYYYDVGGDGDGIDYYPVGASLQSSSPIFYESFDSNASIAANGGIFYLSNSVLDSSFEPGVVGNALHTRLNEFVQYNITGVENINFGTIEFLYKTTSSYHGILELDSNGGWSTGNPYMMSFVNYNVTFIEGGSQYYNPKIVTDNVWHHVALIWRCGQNDSGINIYLDGKQGSVFNYWTGCKEKVFNQPLTLVVGKSSWYSYAEGVFDELKVYNYTKSSGEISQDFSSYLGSCVSNSDCGTDGLTGNLFCQSGNVYRDYTTFMCNNPATPSSSCSNSSVPQLVETCSNGCSNGMCNIAFVKPASTGNVKVVGRNLIVNGVNYKVKGVGYSPVPIGESADTGYDVTTHPELDARDFPLLRQMGVNTIRTWGKVGQKSFLDDAWNNGNRPIRVIMGFWMGTGLGIDYEDSTVRDQFRQEFRDYVTSYKNHPAVLVWAIGNEENYFYANGNNTKLAAYFSLVNEMAQDAYAIEGANYHPVMALALEMPNQMTTVGNAAGGAGDENLSYVDVWGINHYPGSNLSSFFNTYVTKSSKPLIVTEYGIDSFNYSSGSEYQDVQASWNVNLWNQINSSIAVGGSLMEYSDEFWKNYGGGLSTHDTGGYATTSHPDGYANEEYWGIVSIAKNLSGGVDIVTPKKAFYALQNAFMTACERADFNVDGKVDLQDFGTMKDYFGKVSGALWTQGDANMDGATDLQDFGLLKDNFAKGCSEISTPLTAAESALAASLSFNTEVPSNTTTPEVTTPTVTDTKTSTTKDTKKIKKTITPVKKVETKKVATVINNPAASASKANSNVIVIDPKKIIRLN